jgi:hypothetical protein
MRRARKGRLLFLIIAVGFAATAHADCWYDGKRSSAVIGRTVDAKIGAAPRRVKLLSEETLRIEPDDVCTIITATAEDRRTTICAVGTRRRA